jgi:cysteine desulfurase
MAVPANAETARHSRRAERTHPGLVGGPIYLDYNATTPVDPRVAEAALPYLTHHFGNPSSGHRYADEPRAALAAARAQVANLICAEPDSIVFTGSGSEADALAIQGGVLATNGRHVITQTTEHPAVLGACATLKRRHSVETTYLPVDATGRVLPADLRAALSQSTSLVSIMYANNETGVLQPIAELAAIAHEHGALRHTDAAQAVGKIPINVAELDVDLLTIVGHKMYAPKGIGALYVRPGVRLEPLVRGGGQEQGFRPGTENTAWAVALGAAAQIAGVELIEEGNRLRGLRDRLHQRLIDRLPGRVQLNGDPVQRLPNTLNVTITGVRSDDLLANCPQIAASTGSACHTGNPEPSPVLSAMGHDADHALGALRLTLGRWTSQADVDQAADHIAEVASARSKRGTHERSRHR